MRVALFSDTYTPEINGVVSSVVTLKEGLERQGHEVYVVTTHPSLTGSSYENKVLRLPGLQVKQIYGYVLTSPIHINAYQRIKELNCDIFHVHTEFGIGVFARLVSRLTRTPLVVTYHTTYEDYTHYVNVFDSKLVESFAKSAVSRLSKLIVDSGDWAIAPSQKTKEMLENYGVKRDISVIPTGLDLERFKTEKLDTEKLQFIRNELGLKDERVILYVGRIAKEKSIDVLIEAFAKLKQTNLRLVIVGGGPNLDELKALARKLKLENVDFIGKKPSEDIPYYYALSDAFVSASMTETQGLTFIEALAGGVSVFAQDKSVLSDLITEGENGYFFESVDELSTKLEQFVQCDSDVRQSMRQNAVESVQRYGLDVFVDEVVQVYQKTREQVLESMSLNQVEEEDDVIKLELSSKNRELNMLVSKYDFVEYGLRKGNTMDKETIDQLLNKEQVMKAYQHCIRRIAVKDRSRKEMYDYLIENTTLEIKEINDIIEFLEDKRYLDDKRLAKEMVMSLQGLLQGKKKIEKNLLKRGISRDIIDDTLSESDWDHEQDAAASLLKKIKHKHKDRSLRVMKQKLTQALFNEGYTYATIQEVLQSHDFTEEERQEMDNLRKAALKAKKRYQNKHSATALRNAVFNYLDHQGYGLDDIYIVLNEMEFDDE